jgi:hypothetical protein
MRVRYAVAALVFVTCVVAGCEALVDGQLVDVRCNADGQVGAPACPDGLICRAGTCSAMQWGQACAADSDCLPSEFCLDPTTFGGTGAKECSRVCCAAGDCDPDSSAVCWTPPSGGGSLCRAAAEVDVATPGTVAALGSCSQGSDCRSGRCDGQRCEDSCCSDTGCAPDGTCRLQGPPAQPALGFWCGTPPGTVVPYAQCSSDQDCTSGLCLDFGLAYPLCGMPCCSSDECSPTSGLTLRCTLLDGPHAGVRACLPEVAVGTGEVGTGCLPDSDCRSGMCVQLGGASSSSASSGAAPPSPTGGRLQCTDLCCSDSSCGDSSSEVCRPAMVKGSWALRCEPN